MIAKTNPLLGAILTGAFLLIGCDNAVPAERIAAGPSSLVDDTTTDGEAAPGVLGSVTMQWVVPDPLDEALVDGLTLEIQNSSARNYALSGRLICRGLLHKERSIEIASAALPAGGSVSLTFDSADLPVQTKTGFVQSRPEIELTNTDSDEESHSSVTGPIIYYQHGHGYSGIRVLDEAGLLTQADGKLVVEPASATKGKKVIGRVANGLGGFDDVDLLSDEFASKTGGHVAGRETGMDISVEVEGVAEEVVE